MALKKALRLILSALIVLGKGATLPTNLNPEFNSLGSHDPLNITSDLLPHLSPSASIQTNPSVHAPRWSDYHAPVAGWLVNVAEERDVAATIRFCNEHGLQFLAQAGGNGWAGTWSLREEDVVINLRGLNDVAVVREGGDVIMQIGGGSLNGEAIAVAEREGVEILNGGCNCVSLLGSTLGGGVSRWMNKHGLPADNLLAATVALANGSLVTASEGENEDLLWALRRTGANFGIVTSATLRAYPTQVGGRYWAGDLVFEGNKLEDFVTAMNGLHLNENMTVHWGFSHRGSGEPVVTAEIFWMAPDPEAGRDAFASLYALEPIEDTTQVVAYSHLNDDTIGFCEDGGRKPGWHTGLRSLDPETFRQVWDLYVDFVNATGAVNSGVLVECYSNDAIRTPDLGKGASYAHRDINFYAMTILVYEDAALDPVAEAYGEAVRDLWRSSSGFEQSRAYINFTHGDEPLEEIYGESLPRLRVLKRKWDPEGKFNQWFPIV